MSQPSDPNARASHGVATRLSHAGRSLSPDMPFVNVPVVRASTVLFEDVAAMHGPDTKYHYGRRGTPTSEALTDAMNELEGAAGTVLAPSGLAAISVALLSCLSAGDHLLVTDTAYRPTRNVCNGVLKRMGIETTYFDPALGAGVEALFKPNTKAIFTEAPGSLTFEMMDIPAIAEVAHRHGATVLMDNTWATPLFFKPLDHGVDISLMAATKYVVGHSDAMIGTVSANARAWPALRSTSGDLGMFTGPDDMWLALRGLRTMAVRLERHQTSTLAVTRWMETHPAVERVLYPALESDPGHALWKRDFCGASGLFGAILKPCSKAAVAAMLDGLELFGLGYSWGGFESLAIPCDMSGIRTATPWDMATPLVRFHIGLEDPKDLIADLAKGFERLMAHG
jgi:cysteine-S-conjugate beta-lyase